VQQSCKIRFCEKWFFLAVLCDPENSLKEAVIV